jgi:hypothetical protein
MPCQSSGQWQSQSMLLARERLGQLDDWAAHSRPMIRRQEFCAVAKSPSLRWARNA